MKTVLSALEHLDCAALNHDEWIRVGMALKNEGYDLSVWDEWSSRDPARYHPGECAKRWRSFQGNANPVTGASIVKMAMDRGWSLFQGGTGAMDWDGEISYDGDAYGGDSGDGTTAPAAAGSGRPGTEQLRLYLETLFAPEDHVGYQLTDLDGAKIMAKLKQEVVR